MTSFVSDIAGDFIGGITGTTAQERGAGRAAGASIESARIQAQSLRDAQVATEEAAARGQEFLSPFGAVGQQGLDQAGFLTDPQQQFDFLQSNPLFQLALQNANQQTGFSSAAKGRFSAGDTLQQLSNNVLLSAQPLIGAQSQNIAGLLDFGRGLATTQANVEIGTGTNVANLLADIGAVQAGGVVGASNARQQGAQAQAQLFQGLLNLGGQFGGAAIGASDIRLKTNVKPKGERNGHKWFSWDWNELAKALGLTGSSEGVLAHLIRQTNPEAVVTRNGYWAVNYTLLGV